MESSAGSKATGAGTGAAATLIGLTGVTGSGMVLNGWVFFICTGPPVGLAGGSGKTVIRAVSFFGPGLGLGTIGRGGGGGATAAGGGVLGNNGAAGGNGAAPGVTGLPLNSGGGVTALAGAGGTGAAAMGGRAAGPAPGGRSGVGRGGGGAPLAGGRAGILIRTVSRPGVGAPPAGAFGRGGKVILTVSFFGSGESAI